MPKGSKGSFDTCLCKITFLTNYQLVRENLIFRSFRMILESLDQEGATTFHSSLLCIRQQEIRPKDFDL